MKHSSTEVSQRQHGSHRVTWGLPASRLVSLPKALAIGLTLATISCGPNSEVVDSSVCLSEEQWVGGESGDPEMQPGNACIDCHSDTGGPKFYGAGTVYGALDEADDCYGKSGVEVIITDADGDEFKTTTNGSGNFYFKKSIKKPYTAKVIADGIERKMVTPQTEGDCNTCHTKSGNSDAQGRIVAGEL